MKIINIFRNFFFLIFNLKFLFLKKKLEPNHKLDRPLIVSLTSKKTGFISAPNINVIIQSKNIT